MSGEQVCVIGGGLAGISAALRLADTGAAVTLVESRPELGGATYSIRRRDVVVDTGQHVFLRCYREYRALLDRLGTAERTTLQDRFAVPVLQPGRKPGWLLRGRGLPAPADLLPTLARYRLLSPTERVRAALTAAALARIDPDDVGADEVSFGAWLRARGEGERAMERLWGLIALPALNAQPDEASLALAARVFRTGLLAGGGAAEIGTPDVPLVDLHAAPARRLLARLGARVLTRTRVAAIYPEPLGFRVAAGGEELTADAVVLAVPHPAAARLVPEQAAPQRDRWRGLGAAPIVNVHVVYDRPVTTFGFAAVVGSPVQWVFDRSTSYPGRGQHLVVSLSAAGEQVGQPAAQVAKIQLAALAELFPKARDVPVRDVFVTREPRATFRQAPGSRLLRPPAVTALSGLALAGAWTDTGWPDTMEGAVRSGQQAADVVLAHLAAWHATRKAMS